MVHVKVKVTVKVESPTLSLRRRNFVLVKVNSLTTTPLVGSGKYNYNSNG